MPEPTLRVVGRRAAPQRVGTARVAERVLADIDNVVEHIGQALATEIPEYGVLQVDTLTDRVLSISRLLVTSFFDALRDERPLLAQESRALALSGRSRLEMGVPLEAVLHAFRLGGRICWEAIVAAVEPGEEFLLAPLAANWMGHVDTVSSAVAAEYLEASHQRLRALDARRRELVEALLTATDPAEVAAVSLRFSTVLAGAYIPVLVTATGVSGRIDRILREAPPRTLGGHRGGGDRVLLLVPGAGSSMAPDSRLLSCEPEGLVVQGRPAAPGSSLLAEVQRVEQVAQAAAATGHGTGTYGPDDLLVERLLLAEPAAAAALQRTVVATIRTGAPGSAADLLATLTTYLHTGSVPLTAEQVLVHPNTVSYRLGRVRELTGLDPRIPEQATLLVLGLAGSRLQEELS